MQTIKKKLVVGGVIVAAGVGTTLVGASWLADGQGEGFAEAGIAQALTTSQSSPSSVLYPEGTAGLALTIDNPNPYPVTVTSVTNNGTITSGVGGCDPDHGVSFADQSGLDLQVPASGSASFELADAVAMAESSPSECQGATFTIPVALTGASGWTDSDGSGGFPQAGQPCDGADVDLLEEGEFTSTGECTDDTDDTYWYLDADLDGFGSDDPSAAIPAGSPGSEGHVVIAGDCNDSDPAINPDAIDVANGVDDDCDGQVDEDAAP